MPEKYKDEIEEILKQADDLLSHGRGKSPERKQSTKRDPSHPPRPTGGRQLPRVSAGKVMLAALGLLVVALVLNATGGPVMLFVGLGLGLVVVAYVLFFLNPGSMRFEKRWRGRLIEDDHVPFWGRFKRWLKS